MAASVPTKSPRGVGIRKRMSSCPDSSSAIIFIFVPPRSMPRYIVGSVLPGDYSAANPGIENDFSTTTRKGRLPWSERLTLGGLGCRGCTD